MRRMGLVVACVGTLLVAACGGSGSAHTTDPTLKRPSSTTTSTTLSYAVPATIDAAYVDRVMKALDHVYGDAIRHLAQVKSMDPYFVDRLNAIYTPEESTFEQSTWSLEQQKSGFDRLKDDPSDPVTTTTRAIVMTPQCIFVAVDRDFGAIYKDPKPKLPNRYIGLVRPSSPPTSTVNPTPWVMKLDGFKQSGEQPENPCG
jgi:hypothetical protein